MSLFNMDAIHGDEHLLPELTAEEINIKVDDFLSGHIKDAAEILMDKVSQDAEIKDFLLLLAGTDRDMDCEYYAKQLRKLLINAIKEMAQDDEF